MIRTSEFVQVFGRRRWRAPQPADTAGVRKAPRHEIAVGGAAAVPQALWGLSHGVWLGDVGWGRWLCSVCRIARVSRAGWPRLLQVVRDDWRCGGVQIEETDANVGAAGGAPAGV